MDEMKKLRTAIVKWKQRTLLTMDEMKTRIESSITIYPPQIDNIEEVKVVENHLTLGLLYKEAYKILKRSQYCQMPLEDRQRIILIEEKIEKRKKDIEKET